jgi:hypothetical protein
MTGYSSASLRCYRASNCRTNNIRQVARSFLRSKAIELMNYAVKPQTLTRLLGLVKSISEEPRSEAATI